MGVGPGRSTLFAGCGPAPPASGDSSECLTHADLFSCALLFSFEEQR